MGRHVDPKDVSKNSEAAAAAADRKFRKELSAGTTALALLSILRSAVEPMYGYQIAKLMEEDDQKVPLIKHGALYPVLRSLEGNGLLASRVEPSVSGPPRRYYNITDQGLEALARWGTIWNRTCRLMDRILGGALND
ncbi:MAG: PadR family transcriptional regulator [Candidatus Fermentibacteraceae bacterium]|nr:PadR family transcriptional regulator [Candidatus Fermentibacteraceae bacterium]MBN2608565.1 PadR family transcriptional regulator [Candidatus Fermentibacteraceae bacterium]